MNATKAWVFWVIGIIGLGFVVWAFATGVEAVSAGDLTGLYWVVGSLVFAALGVFLSYKLKK